MRPSVLLVLGAILGCGYTQPVTGQPRVRDLDASDQQTAAEQAKSARLRATHAAKVDETKLVVAPTEADIEQFRAQQKAQAAEAIANLDAEIAQLQAKLEKAKKANERKRLESQLAELNTQLTAAKVQAPNKLPTLLPEELKTGELGKLGAEGSFVEVVQVVDARNMLVKAGSRRIWIADVSTEGLADQQDLVLTNLFKVAGTKTYRTAGNNTQTVFRLQPVNLEAVLAGETQEQLEWRTWKTAEFEISTPARIQSVQNNNVLLETKTGTKFTVGRRSFNADDQLRIERFLAQSSLSSKEEPGKLIIISDPDVKVDTRRQWLNTSYDTTIFFVKDKQWAEVDNKTKKLKWYLVEKDRNHDYVELFNAERAQTWRLQPTKMDFLQGGQWRWLSHGQWTTK